MDAYADDPALRTRANDLYWRSDESVNQIAEDLDMSKGALYNLVEPLPASLPCPLCSAEMEYPNRTARDKGFLTCPDCDLEEEEELVRAEWRGAARETREGTMVVSPGSGASAREAAEHRARSHQLWLASVLLGAAVGVAVVLWRRRS